MFFCLAESNNAIKVQTVLGDKNRGKMYFARHNSSLMTVCQKLTLVDSYYDSYESLGGKERVSEREREREREMELVEKSY